MRDLLRKLLNGFVFGIGFMIAMLMAYWGFSFYMLSGYGPVVSVSSDYPPHSDRAPQSPETALLKSSPSDLKVRNPEFRFFDKSGRTQMEIPEGGGILAMSVLPTPSDAVRPRTFQLWLTHDGFWKIRTDEMNVEVEQIPYPQLETGMDVSLMLFDRLGDGAHQSTSTISDITVEALKRGTESGASDRMNGTLRITTAGVVLLMPNPIER